MKNNETSEKNYVNSKIENEYVIENNNLFSEARIGFDKIFRRSNKISSNSKKNYRRNNFDNNISYNYVDNNSDLKEDNLKKGEKILYEDSDINSVSFEDILLKNSKNLHKYKTEGCLVVYDDKLEIQKNYKIDFATLLNTLSYDPSSSENFIDGLKGRWVDEFEKGIDSKQNGIEFDSRFESGNLRMAIKVDTYEYDLILHNDINSDKTSSWFYFELKLWAEIFLTNIESEVNTTCISNKLKLNIINLHKKDSLFSAGLRVLMYSCYSNKWSRDTHDVFYYPNGFSMNDKNFYTLTFSFNPVKNISTNLSQDDSLNEINKDVENTPSTFYFSYCFPYTYTDLIHYLTTISNKDNIKKRLKIETVGKSLCANSLYMITISNLESSSTEIAARPSVILTARVHPGESNSSLVIQGVIDFLLLQDDPIAQALRDKYLFKIIPMLNPDGVINGNYRSCVNGKDLNRMWVDPRSTICPTLFYTKEMVKTTLSSRKVYMFCDFHGHSKKNNFFIFGCPVLNTSGVRTEEESIYAGILKNVNDCFDSTSCVFKLSKNKMKTARAVMKNEFGLKFSYCLESSIGGITIGERINKFFTPEDYFGIGRDFCVALNEMQKKDKIFHFEKKMDKKSHIVLKKSNSVGNYQKNIKMKFKPKTKVKTEKIEKIKILNKENHMTTVKEHSFSKKHTTEKKLFDSSIKTQK